MENLKDLYLEHEKRITDNLPEIKHVDLWSEQVGFMEEEHPFKAPAVFFSYRIIDTDDQGKKLQQLRLQAEVYLYFETFADTKRGSKRQQKALAFLDLLTKINACFHGSHGKYFAEMRRTGFDPVETGTANLLYVQRYELTVSDSSAQVLENELKFESMEVQVDKAEPAAVVKANDLYDV
ncbi:hypothetical protein ML462_13995 [Gramella lutea]|uniref:Uncharacterized protein n=1 Tax=Christiangramia lutea TaxID=1607951 RepID=A0A9X1V509_9FLAO|nr:hypothetical protein [Christiangramia lutea]MCH4824283.1 hypothetical protein [Christiangramia lutea]